MKKLSRVQCECMTGGEHEFRISSFEFPVTSFEYPI